MRPTALQMAPTPATPRPGTDRAPRIWAGSCVAGTCSCRRSTLRANQYAGNNRHHGAANLDLGRNVFVRPVFEPDVDGALAPHPGSLFAGDRHTPRVRQEPVLDCEGAKGTAARSGGWVLFDSERIRSEHPAVKPVRTGSSKQEHRQRCAPSKRLAKAGSVGDRSVDCALVRQRDI